jgi:hypothetical protein
VANADLALEVQDGVTIENGAGYFSGFDSPTFDAPIGSLYIKTDATRYIKNLAGAGGDKWIQDLPIAASAKSLVTNVYNNSGATILKGSIVYIDGSHGFLPTIHLSKADAESTSARTYGLVVSDITDHGSGTVVHSGIIENLDTHGLTEGVILYLSPTVAGEYTVTKPSAPNHLVYIGVCTRSHPTFGTIEVTIQNGYELDELHNVSAISPTNKDIIRYNTETSLWEKNSDLTTLETTVSGLKDVAITFYALPGTTGHSHTIYLTWDEANSLMRGTSASVVKDTSDTSSGTAHVHSTTITWDADCYKFVAITATALAHIHSVNANSPSDGWQILGKTQLTSAANSTSIITIPARTLLRVTCIVTGYSGGGIASLRFGTTAGAVDSGNNYNTRFIRMNSGANNNFTDVPTTSTNFLRLASQTIVLGRQYTVNITNFATVRKMCSISTASEAGAVGTAANLDVGQGMYANTTAQIITVQLISTANNLSIGSGFIVEGINLV